MTILVVAKDLGVVGGAAAVAAGILIAGGFEAGNDLAAWVVQREVHAAIAVAFGGGLVGTVVIGVIKLAEWLDQ